MNYWVILYYKYIEIKNTNEICQNQKKLCEELRLKGRVLIASEGINGTLCGTIENCQKYISYMNLHELFCEIDFKINEIDFCCFEKLQIKEKHEIVNFGFNKPINPSYKDSAPYITPDELHKMFESKNFNNTVIIDIRNNYESRIGKFDAAITPDIKTSREFYDYFINNKDIFKNKDVVMYCTGGVRCEKTSAALAFVSEAKSIRHLKGGICRYVEKYPNGYFRGRNYVFDDRISVKVNNDILTHCDICNISCDLYNNCLNALCNKHYISCDECIKKTNGCCSNQCFDLTQKRAVPLRPPLVSRNGNILLHNNQK
jgi:UPF0176 protein